MLRVDAKQGAPKDGHYPLELFHVSFLFQHSLLDLQIYKSEPRETI